MNFDDCLYDEALFFSEIKYIMIDGRFITLHKKRSRAISTSENYN